MFTYDFYTECLKKLENSGYSFRQFDDPHLSDSHSVLLRHDVDSDFLGTLALGRLEKAFGVNSIFFFQPNNDFYNMLSNSCLSVIEKLQAMGHRIGLHIDGEMAVDEQSLNALVERMYQYYACHFSVARIVSFHKPGPFVLDQDLKLNGFINTYEKRFFKDMKYFSDSDRRRFWEQGFFETIDMGSNLQLLTHPFWWGPYEQSVYEAFSNYSHKMRMYYAENFRKNFLTYKKALSWLNTDEEV